MASQEPVRQKSPTARQFTRDAGAIDSPAPPAELDGVISIVQHALEGAERCRKYLGFARREGERELAEFFEGSLEEHELRAERGKRLLSFYLDELEDEGDDGLAGDEER